jgi:hypothetical protein
MGAMSRRIKSFSTGSMIPRLRDAISSSIFECYLERANRDRQLSNEAILNTEGRISRRSMLPSTAGEFSLTNPPQSASPTFAGLQPPRSSRRSPWDETPERVTCLKLNSGRIHAFCQKSFQVRLIV